MTANFLLASFVSGMLGFAMFIVSLFLILLILVQRGRGGGLTGALGGPGGQSAFGTKAGDLFTRVTAFVALGWIVLCAFVMWLLGPNVITKAVDAPAVSSSPADTKTTSQDLIDLTKPSAVPTDTSDSDKKANDVELTPANDSVVPTDSSTPASETPAADAPAADAPAGDAPASATPAAEGGAVPAPAATEAPASDAAPVENAE